MSIRRFTNRMSSLMHPHHNVNQDFNPTPVSEKSIYLDSQTSPSTPGVDDNQPLTDAQADVYRQPSVAVGRATSPSAGPAEENAAKKVNGISSSDAVIGGDHPSPPYERHDPMPGALRSTPDIYTADKKIDFAKKAPFGDEIDLKEKHKAEPMVAQVPREEKATMTQAPESSSRKLDEPVTNEKAIAAPVANMPQASTIKNGSTSVVEEPRPASITLSNSGSLLRHSKERSINGAFSQGPGLTGPAAMVETDESQHQRMTSAESMLDMKTRTRLAKEDEKVSRRISKMIKSEGKSQKKNLDIAISELAKIEKIQKQAAADESKALTKHAKAIKAEHRSNMDYLSAKAKHESAVADLKAHVERLEACKEHARLQTELLQQKTREVEELRQQKAVDERERELKLKELATKPAPLMA